MADGTQFDYDFIVVGSGFGGSVSALRLSEKGYKVAVLEMGKRFGPDDYAKSNLDARKFLWLPELFLYGIQQITLLRDVMVLHGAGVGGGSLVYANTLLIPSDTFFKDPKWADLADWKSELAPHYQTALKMLGAVETPHLGKTEELLREVASETGRGDTFHKATVGVYFGKAGEKAPDPFFGGKGPERSGCTLCGGCMVGCRYNAKNTLDKNYLYLAEQLGATVIPETRVTDLKPIAGGGWELQTEKSTAFLIKPKRTLRAKNVVVAAGVMGSVGLLAQCKDRGSIPNLPAALGSVFRTNSEALIGSKSKDSNADYSTGTAIEAGFYPEEHTHIETVRYPKYFDLMGLLATLLVGGGPPWPRPLRFLGAALSRPIDFLRNTLNIWGWARRTTILLVMQPLDNAMSLKLTRPWYWPFKKKLDSDRGNASAVPTFIPVGNATAEKMAAKMNGTPESVLPEVLLNLSSTAHVLGGCTIGHGPDDGVVDKDCRVFGQEGLWVIDGSVVPANLGVNPSLTITAIAEHAMSRVARKMAN